tara:strand:- start:1636 stop:2010 length:375 start_codon:yes stop_codon:yes gene_type:complete
LIDSQLNTLYYDDKCPLCISSVNFIKKFIKPKSIKIESLKNAKLNQALIKRALKEMLFIQKDGSFVWGFETYRKLFHLSNSKFKIIFKLIFFITSFYIFNKIGKKIYSLIANSRKRCDDNSCQI